MRPNFFIMTTFHEFGLNPNILRAIGDLSFETPTPIQSKVIPLLQADKQDLIALAQTGTGKTAAFGLPILQMLNAEKRHTQALILSPTRELCIQICEDLHSYSKYIKNVNITPVYGGASIVNQIRQLERGSQIIVATPGRMVDLMNRGCINLSKLQWLVLDEADEMLNMGFKEELDEILSKTPESKNTLLFSATMPNEVGRIARTYMINPVEVIAGVRNAAAENVEHICFITNVKDRYLALKRMVDFNPDIYGLVFCRTKIETQQIADALIKDGYSADCIHGDLSQAQRDSVMRKFRGKVIQLLIATDVAARGIDVDDLTHVINYNLPDEIEQYTHRSGRTGRAGKTGIALSIIGTRESDKIRAIEKQIGKKLVIQKIPTGREVCERQLLHQIKEFKKTEIDETEIDRFLPQLMDEFKDMSREELIKMFVSAEFNRFLSYYKNSPDLNSPAPRIDKIKDSTRMFINMGQMDGFDKDSLKKYIIKIGNMQKTHVFSVDIHHAYSFFEVDNLYRDTLAKSFSREKFNKRSVRIDNAEHSNRDNFQKNKSYDKKVRTQKHTQHK